MGTKTHMSIHEFERLPDDELRHELDEGELISIPPAGEEHGFIGTNISGLLWSFVRQHNLGRIYLSDTGFILAKDTVRAPDIAFVRRERVVPSKGFFQGAPDLAVEVVSPSEPARQLKRKVGQYLSAGCQAVWIVYPDEKRVHVFRSGSDRVLDANDVLEAPELLPGFSVRVGELFE